MSLMQTRSSKDLNISYIFVSLLQAVRQKISCFQFPHFFCAVRVSGGGGGGGWGGGGGGSYSTFLWPNIFYIVYFY